VYTIFFPARFSELLGILQYAKQLQWPIVSKISI